MGRPSSAGANEPAKDSLDLRVMAVVVEDEEGNKAEVVSPKAVAQPPGISIAALGEEAKAAPDEAKEKEGDSPGADGQLGVPGKKRKKMEKDKRASSMSNKHKAGMNETQHSRRGFGAKKGKGEDENEGKPEKVYKKHLFITSRVHPGES